MVFILSCQSSFGVAEIFKTVKHNSQRGVGEFKGGVEGETLKSFKRESHNLRQSLCQILLHRFDTHIFRFNTTCTFWGYNYLWCSLLIKVNKSAQKSEKKVTLRSFRTCLRIISILDFLRCKSSPAIAVWILVAKTKIGIAISQFGILLVSTLSTIWVMSVNRGVETAQFGQFPLRGGPQC